MEGYRRSFQHLSVAVVANSNNGSAVNSVIRLEGRLSIKRIRWVMELLIPKKQHDFQRVDNARHYILNFKVSQEYHSRPTRATMENIYLILSHHATTTTFIYLKIRKRSSKENANFVKTKKTILVYKFRRKQFSNSHMYYTYYICE